jgi:hypothetical protein
LILKTYVHDALKDAKRRAKRFGHDFNITKHDIEVPEYCPILGIKLECGIGRAIQSSPSLDRLDNSKGYTPDNVWIISRLANQMKNEANIEQLLNFSRWVQLTYGNTMNKLNNNVEEQIGGSMSIIKETLGFGGATATEPVAGAPCCTDCKCEGDPFDPNLITQTDWADTENRRQALEHAIKLSPSGYIPDAKAVVDNAETFYAFLTKRNRH